MEVTRKPSKSTTKHEQIESDDSDLDVMRKIDLNVMRMKTIKREENTKDNETGTKTVYGESVQ